MPWPRLRPRLPPGLEHLLLALWSLPQGLMEPSFQGLLELSPLIELLNNKEGQLLTLALSLHGVPYGALSSLGNFSLLTVCPAPEFKPVVPGAAAGAGGACGTRQKLYSKGIQKGP